MHKRKKIILSAKKDDFWVEIVQQLKKNGYMVPYWIGANASDQLIDNCFFHEVVDAYELKNLYKVEYKIFDIKKLNLDEYYNYLKILDRGDNIGGYSFSQRDRLFKEQLSYWYSVLAKVQPNLVVFSNLPHLLYDYPLYLVAKNMGVKTLIFNVTPFRGWHYVTDSLFSLNEEPKKTNLVKCSIEFNNYESFNKVAVEPYVGQKYSAPSYMVKQFEYDKKSKKRFVKKIVKKILLKLRLIKFKKGLMRGSWQKNIFDFFGVNDRIPGIGYFYRYLLSNFKSDLKIRYEKATISPGKLKSIGRYVYVPLHYQPEATTAPLGNLYSDQIYMIEILRESLPSDVSIIVKEHYSQFSGALSGFRGRYLDYWDKIIRLENTFLAPLNSDPKNLIVNSLAVATVTGTSGWEAIQYGKYCIAFGEPWYYSYPGLIKYDEDFSENLKKIISSVAPKNYTNEFIEVFCQSLVKVDIHSYSDGEVRRDPNVIVKVITEFLKNKESHNV